MTSPAPRTPPAPGSATLLLIDDTPENLTVLGGVLAPYYRVKVANSGERGLAIALAERPDLILLDVMMPGMDGYEVLWRLQNHEATHDIPVIFVTALDSADDETRGLDLGVVDYITKPVQPAIVLARVRTHLELAAARHRLQDINTWLEGEVRRRMRENQIVQDASMRALASIAEIRDNETGAHILRTQGYVRVLAESLASRPEHAAELGADMVELLAKAAPLHDMGKVGIPDAILHKPAKLDPAEWEIMKTHAALGADAIERVIASEEEQGALRFLQVAADLARSHHEKWDGSGYPDGLAGRDIPLAGRIMAVADVFDALISRRVYKPAFTIERAVALITEGRGRHFDPDVVEAFVENIEAFRAIAERYADQYTRVAEPA